MCCTKLFWTVLNPTLFFSHSPQPLNSSFSLHRPQPPIASFSPRWQPPLNPSFSTTFTIPSKSVIFTTSSATTQTCTIHRAKTLEYKITKRREKKEQTNWVVFESWLRYTCTLSRCVMMSREVEQVWRVQFCGRRSGYDSNCFENVVGSWGIAETTDEVLKVVSHCLRRLLPLVVPVITTIHVLILLYLTCKMLHALSCISFC